MLRYLVPAAATGLAALVLQACATGASQAPEPTAEAAEVLANFERTDETRSCLSTRSIDSIEPLDDRFWLIEMRGGDTFLNEVGPGCFGADNSFNFLEYETRTGQLCRGEIVNVVDQTGGAPRGSCGLGDYVRLIPIE